MVSYQFQYDQEYPLPDIPINFVANDVQDTFFLDARAFIFVDKMHRDRHSQLCFLSHGENQYAQINTG